MTARFNMIPRHHLLEAHGKQALNYSLFTEVAPKYDFVTKALSLGRDGAWKRSLIADLPSRETPACLDLACGTGDITRLLARRYPKGRITGLDLTPAMLDIAAQHSQQDSIRFVEGSMHALPFSDASQDIVTGGYALRNAPDLDQALDEICRVLRVGGVASFLDFSKPQSRLGQLVSHGLLKSWGAFWGLVLHGNANVYGYIADSLWVYPDRTQLQEKFRQRGFILRHRRRFYGGLLESLSFHKGISGS